MRVISAGLLFAMLSTAGCGAPPASKAPASTTAGVCETKPSLVVLMRHAEKASEEGDPDLSGKGRDRARRIATLFAQATPARLYATDVKRTQQTLLPLAEHKHVHVEVRPARETAALANELATLPTGTVAIVAHHSNGVPVLAHALGVELPGVTEGALAHDAFGRVFVIALGCGARPASYVELSSD